MMSIMIFTSKKSINRITPWQSDWCLHQSHSHSACRTRRASADDVVTNSTKPSDVNISDVWRSLLNLYHYTNRIRSDQDYLARLAKICTVKLNLLNLLIFVDLRPSKAPPFFERAQRIVGDQWAGWLYVTVSWQTINHWSPTKNVLLHVCGVLGCNGWFMYFMQLDLEVFFLYKTMYYYYFFYKSAISGRRRADIDVLKPKINSFNTLN